MTASRKRSARMYRSTPRGWLVLSMVIFGAVAIIMLGGLVSLGLIEGRAENQKYQSERAFQVAEAGVNYYRWHLAHAPVDYKDGTNNAGPYVHDYIDNTGVTIGRYSLVITPPPIGSTLVTVDSTGYLLAYPQWKRTVRAKFAIPSFAKFAVVSNDNMRYGSGTVTYGELHSNGGTQFDGTAHNIVESSVTSYNDTDSDVQATKPGVWSSISPDTSVFLAGKQYPVPAVDFSGLSANLANLKAQAQAGGFYRAASGVQGYHIILKNNNTFDLYKVKKVNAQGTCDNLTWSITSGQETFLGNNPYPANGVIFIEDHVWVEGNVNQARVTIGAGTFPESPATDKNIIVNNNLTYTHSDGEEAVGLIAQGSVLVGLSSADTLTIDAALVAVDGNAGRPHYNTSKCGSSGIRSQLTLYGSIASYTRYGFAYTDGNGYQIRNINYDANLLYSPPPQYPLTTDQYSIIDWEDLTPQSY